MSTTQYGARWALELRRERASVTLYGLQNAATLAPEEIAVEPDGSRFTVERPTIRAAFSRDVSTFGTRSRRSASRGSWASRMRRAARGLGALERVARSHGTRSTPAASRSWSITRTLPTRSRARCVRCARRRAGRWPSSSDAAEIATAESGRRWARSPPASPIAST